MLKKSILLGFSPLVLLTLSACSQNANSLKTPFTSSSQTSKAKTEIEYYTDTDFEKLLNSGKNMTGETVKLKVLDYKPDTRYGNNMWAGEHLNFISENERHVRTGDTLIVTITDAVKSHGSWFMTYEDGAGPVNVSQNNKLRTELKKYESELSSQKQKEELDKSTVPDNAKLVSIHQRYQKILDEYSEKILDTTPSLVTEYNINAASNTAGADGLAELSNKQIEILAEISNNGISEMAQIMLKYDNNKQDPYTAYASKLTDVYMLEAQKITNAYIASIQ